ncbi:MAG TPA: LysR family transcriptional regulator [Polyangiaceae bacterium]
MLGELDALVAVARHRSFRRAADELVLGPSTLSHMMRALEEKIGVRLLNRTTRSVSPTEAGQQLVAQLTNVLGGLDDALDAVARSGKRPRGTLRINAAEPGARHLLETIAPTFLARFPEVTLELLTDGRLVDIVKLGFDAGVRLGEAVPQDMIAVRLGGPVRFLVVASPAYLEAHGAPKKPTDLREHRCIRIRLPSGKRYRGELSKGKRNVSVDVPGSLVLDDARLTTHAAAEGLGRAYVPEPTARAYLDEGQLVTVLEDWCPAMPGLFLYYPANRHVPPPLRAFLDVVQSLRRREA